MAAIEAETALKFQTWNLKVSIHCEGCKRKVKKVLQSIEGVYMTSIDAQKQKVTVTGNVAVEILIKKLIKMGKHAELYPEPKPANPNQNGSNGGGGGGGKKNKKNKAKNDGSKPDTEHSDNPEPKNPEPETKLAENGGDTAQIVENSGNSSPKIEKPAGKKKGKKNNNNAAAANNTNNEKPKNSASQNANASKKGNGGGEAKPPHENQKPIIMPQQQQGFNLPEYPLPQYVMSYNSVQPAMAGSYYVPTVTTVTATTAGSYDFFSEENANACIVM